MNITGYFSNDFKQKAKKAGSFLLDKAGDVLGICILCLNFFPCS